MKHLIKLCVFTISLISLTSCGGLEKTNKLTCSTLNRNNKFSIDVPVFVADEADTYFYFQDGYSLNDLKESLDDKKCYYEFHDGDLFINTIIDNKIEYFLIADITSSSETNYVFKSISTLYYDLNGLRRNDYFLIPYFLLDDKKDYLKIEKFCTDYSQTDISFSIACDYNLAKNLYSLTAQRNISYDDNNKKINLYNSLSMTFSNSTLTMTRF